MELMVRSFGFRILGIPTNGTRKERSFGLCKWEKVVTFRNALNVNTAVKLSS